jgi:hypothetical protein
LLLSDFDERLAIEVITNATFLELLLAGLRLTLIASMIVTAVGLWEGKPWGVRMYWVSATLVVVAVAVRDVNLKLTGSDLSWFNVFLGTIFCVVFYGAIGIGIGNSIKLKRS